MSENNAIMQGGSVAESCVLQISDLHKSYGSIRFWKSQLLDSTRQDCGTARSQRLRQKHHYEDDFRVCFPLITEAS